MRTTRPQHNFALMEVLLLMLVLTVLAAVIVPRMVADAVDAGVDACNTTVAAPDARGELCSARTGTLPALLAITGEGEAAFLPDRLPSRPRVSAPAPVIPAPGRRRPQGHSPQGKADVVL